MTHTVSTVLADETLNRIIQIESAGKVKAKASTSSALGLFQFLNATWLDTVRKHRPDLLEGRSQPQALALRTDPSVCIELGARFTEDNARALGAGWTDGDIYLAHFLGIGTARAFLRAKPAASAEKLAGPKAVAANRSILAGKTVAQVRAWAQHSMESRWSAAGSPAWIAKLYDPNSPLVAGHELLEHDDDAPAKVDGEADAPAEPPKSILKSKIAIGAGTIGVAEASEVISQANQAADQVKTLKESASEIGVTDWLGHLATNPRFLLAVAVVVAAGLILWWRWRDHGKGRPA